MKNKHAQTIYYGTLNHGNWTIYIAATDQGLCFVGSPNKAINKLQIWTDKNRPNARLIEDDEKVSNYVHQTIEYLHGKRKTFDIPLDLKGTSFQKAVWKELQNIPYGEVVSYSDIAEKIGRPNAVRAVGTANGANPVMMVVPCHRVISKSGSLTGFRGGLEMKKALLAMEESNKTRV
ncbi:methylated-DNA--[protein]-cysteine S-methyltransferase [Gracilibacillus caseinilyticus]|uniref:Methylated-DNA--protein-cysteine methyltransferase n=1 Tax=Gracilibacillus caseinilyticus TaxID=2932256 RepID=A0ABY4F144_9BACI|nr:methylated-DNA--[protein]-cysteine S-methyltransferase [Gracilibacillus caseinilyticus]UOQ50395.1 methylated-DNA--[protein]-cysteine S-methyltransferase [Gracilibacillus caseinilyticus]